MQGSGVDTSLNETGLKQSKAFYAAYKDHPFDKIYTSYLQRSIQSVQPFIDAGFPSERLEGLNEINWGGQEGKPFTTESYAYYQDVLKCWQNGDVDKCLTGGESPYQVQRRLAKTLDYILNRQNEKQILICMHGRAMRILLCHMLNYALRYMDVFHHDNLCLYRLAYTGSLFSVEAFNNQDHLRDLKRC